MTLIYSILFFISLYVIFIIWLRIQHPYWSKQPVYHRHKLIYKFYHPGMVRKEPIEKDIYVDTENIEFSTFENIEDISKKLSEFLKYNYQNNEYVTYIPTPESIKSYYISKSSNSYICFLKNKSVFYKEKSQDVEEITKYIGCMSSRPIVVLKNNKKIDAQLVDNLCIDKKYRGHRKVPTIIQSHRYFTENTTKTGQIYFFKNENNNNFNIVPFCKINCFLFDIFTWKTPKDLGQEKMLQITDITSNILTDIIFNSSFKNKVYLDVYTLRQLILSNEIYAYCMVTPNKTLGTYIFKKSNTMYNNETVFECICSIKNCENNLFVQGFHHSANMTCSKYKHRYLVIENTSDNKIIINKISESKKCTYNYNVSYYLYNYITSQVKPNETIFLI